MVGLIEMMSEEQREAMDALWAEAVAKERELGEKPPGGEVKSESRTLAPRASDERGMTCAEFGMLLSARQNMRRL